MLGGWLLGMIILKGVMDPKEVGSSLFYVGRTSMQQPFFVAITVSPHSVIGHRLRTFRQIYDKL